MANTYKSAQKAGFEGSFTDWVKAGRPSAEEIKKTDKKEETGFNTYKSAQKAGFKGTYQDWIKAGRPKGAVKKDKEPTKKDDKPKEGTTGSKAAEEQSMWEDVKGVFRGDIDDWKAAGKPNKDKVISQLMGTEFGQRYRNAVAGGFKGGYEDWVNAGAPRGAAPTETPEEPTTPPTTPVDQNKGTNDALKRIDDAVKNGLLDENTATLFRQVVRNWDVNKELNFDNVLKEFDKISETTIAPFFAEQADVFKKDILQAQQNLQQSRAEELEAEGIRAEQRVKGTQEELERRGLTFSSPAAEQLGSKSAFGGKVQFGGELGEGLVEKQSRLIASGSQRAHQQAIDALGRQAEDLLGQRGAGLVEGFTGRGVTQGTLAQREQQARASALQGLAGQQRNLFDFQKPIEFNF
jgi:hypothetical protein